jgi:hypothetical protein
MKVIIHFFAQLGLLSEFAIDVQTAIHYIEAVSAEYSEVPFHDWSQAVDVTQSLFYQVIIGKLAACLSKLELLALMVAGLCHCIGYKVKAGPVSTRRQSLLMSLYKGQPVNETQYCALAVKTMAKTNCNIISKLESRQQHAFWVMVSDCILSLDFAQHLNVVGEASRKINGRALDMSNPDHRGTLMRLMVLVANFSRFYRPFDETGPWFRIFGDEMMNDDETRGSMINGQSKARLAKRLVMLGRIYARPLVVEVVKAVPALKPVEEQFEVNFVKWSSLADSDA